MEIQDLVLGHEGAMVLTDELWRDFMLCNLKRNVLDWESSLPNTQSMLIMLFSIPFLWAPEHMDIVKLLVQGKKTHWATEQWDSQKFHTILA